MAEIDDQVLRDALYPHYGEQVQADYYGMQSGIGTAIGVGVPTILAGLQTGLVLMKNKTDEYIEKQLDKLNERAGRLDPKLGQQLKIVGENTRRAAREVTQKTQAMMAAGGGRTSARQQAQLLREQFEQVGQGARAQAMERTRLQQTQDLAEQQERARLADLEARREAEKRGAVSQFLGQAGEIAGGWAARRAPLTAEAAAELKLKQKQSGLERDISRKLGTIESTTERQAKLQGKTTDRSLAGPQRFTVEGRQQALSERQAKAQLGLEESAAALQEMGITQEQLEHLSPEQYQSLLYQGIIQLNTAPAPTRAALGGPGIDQEEWVEGMKKLKGRRSASSLLGTVQDL